MTAFLIILLTLLLVLVIGANYFIAFTLKGGRKFKASIVPVDKKYEESEDKKRIRETSSRLKEEAEAWKKTVPVKKLETRSHDGLKLVANLYEKKESHLYVISMHGYKNRKEGMLIYARLFYNLGFNVLLPDQRAHGESEGKYISMGHYERLDIIRWCRLIREMDEKAKIVLHGVSMGASSIMMASGENPEGVVAAVEDCGYSSLWDIFSDELESLYHLPSFPLLHTSSLLSRLRFGYFFKKASATDALSKTRIPMLFFHGDKDRFVKTEMLDIVYAAHPGKKKKVLVPNAAHSEAYAGDPGLYESEIEAFLKPYIT